MHFPPYFTTKMYPLYAQTLNKNMFNVYCTEIHYVYTITMCNPTAQIAVYHEITRSTALEDDCRVNNAWQKVTIRVTMHV